MANETDRANNDSMINNTIQDASKHDSRGRGGGAMVTLKFLSQILTFRIENLS